MTELFSIPTEQAVLCSFMDFSELGDSIEQMDVVDFHATRHQIIFNHIKSQHLKGEGHDAIVIWEKIRSNFNESSQIDETYIMELSSAMALPRLLPTHIKTLKDLSSRRKIAELGKQVLVIAGDTTGYTAESAIERVQSLASGLDSTVQAQGTFKIADVAKRVVSNVIDRHQKLHDGIDPDENILKTGFIELDNKLDRIDPTDLIIIGARPSMGKTTFAQNIFLNLSVNQGKTVLFMSGEMSSEQITERLISCLGQIPLKSVRSARFDSDGAGCIYKATEILNKCSIYINDKSQPSLADIRREARKVKQSTLGKLDAIVIDYLQIMTPPEKSGNKVQEIGDISNGLKKIAKDFGCPVFALSQLNRSLENRPNKRPVMSDIRESGAIEQDADIIMFIYRDEVYNKDSKEAGTAEIIIGKARNGSTGTVRLATDLGRATFCDLSPEYYTQLQVVGQSAGGAA
ncbi:replicative DNA helicase [Acinetobacter sp. YH12064]|uniref:replicative DNA helicase n=1 Tax=Acinetobacter sp. YH12064 TaxID=2601062 RepID=UPI0015D42CED|nr:replicative DNA helicase [Acinetobacter sp. YH12064]